MFRSVVIVVPLTLFTDTRGQQLLHEELYHFETICGCLTLSSDQCDAPRISRGNVLTCHPAEDAVRKNRTGIEPEFSVSTPRL